jgi:predicted metal-dependent phosphoesterase TrpH/glycosyltransferase involved in cell wall biosynthesis
VGLRICLVTPFSWSQPHDVNEHVAGAAAALRDRGHDVTVLAPSNRAADLLAGRRALQNGAPRDVIAVGPAVRISRRSRIGLPVGVRANLALALARGGFDVVHGFEPGLPSISYLALRDSRSLAVATFFSPDRLGYPPGRTQRMRLLSRVDALLAPSAEAADAAGARFPGEYHPIALGVDTTLFAPAAKRRLVVCEWRPGERLLTRAVTSVLKELPDWELILLRTKPLSGRPSIPPSLRGRVHVRTALSGAARAPLLNEAAIFVPGIHGLPRLRVEAEAAGAAVASPPGVREQPALAAAALARLAENDALRHDAQSEARRNGEKQSFAELGRQLADVYTSLARRRQASRPSSAQDPLAGRPWIVCDLHTHTSWSHDCVVDPDELLDHAEREGISAIAITDHNAFGGALEAVELARERELTVIPGEEIKTSGQGEVIGLFLEREIPRGLEFEDTLAAIREQGGLVYLPHPFDRMHAIPDAATLHRHLADIDVFEVYNARLLFEQYNDEALRFARKYNLTIGAGSDAHVLQGLGTGGLRMRAFRDPEEFLVSLRSAEVLRRPRSLAYLQALKWTAQVKERVR